MINQTHPLMGKKIGIFGKGGAGKSTVTALLAHSLRQRDYNVCIVDADSTNIGLHRALGFDHMPAPLTDYFGDTVFHGGRVTCPVDDPTPLPNAQIILDDLPPMYWAGASEEVAYLAAGKIGDQGVGAGCDGPIAKIARDLSLQSGTKPNLMLLDFKAGFEDTARGVVTGLDWAIVVVDPTLAAIHMAADMKEIIEQIKNGALPATEHLTSLNLVELARRFYQQAPINGVLCILNRVADVEMEQYMRDQLAAHELAIGGIIHVDASIAKSWLMGKTIESVPAQQEAESIVETLERMHLSIISR